MRHFVTVTATTKTRYNDTAIQEFGTVHNLCKLEHLTGDTHDNNSQGGGRGRMQFKDSDKVIYAKHFDFLNKTKNEHRCSTILRSKIYS